MKKEPKKEAKLLLTAIFKDDTEAEMADRMLTSFMPYFQGLVVVMTGVSGNFDKLIEVVKKYNGHIATISPETNPEVYLKKEDGSYIFASFAAARNVAFDLASKIQETENYDYWSWADVDDMLVSGEELQAAAVRALELGLDMVYFTYWYSIQLKKDNTFDENDVQIDHIRERLIRPNVCKWVSRLHEIAVAKDDNFKPKQSDYNFNPKENRLCVWAHISNQSRFDTNIKRNIEILELQAKEENYKDPRTLGYLGRSYFDTKDKEKYPEALKLFDKYLELSGWKEERANIREYVALVKADMGDHQGAVDALFEAMKEYGNRHMQYLYLTREYAELGLFEESDFWLDVAVHMEPPKARTTIGNPMQVKFFSASLLYNQAIRKQDIEKAIYWLKVRNEVAGIEDDGMLQTLEEAKLLNNAGMWLFNYAKWLKNTDQADKIPALLKSIPFDLGREPFVQMMSNDFTEPKKWSDKEIVFFASWGAEHFEQWSPKNFDKGIGGSETAVIQLAKEWTKLGYKVTVFGDPREDAGEYENVSYRPWYELNWHDEFSTLILWRSPHLLDREIKAKRIFMDLHDIASQLDWSEERMKKVDKVFFKSQWHRSQLPKLPDSKAVVIPNGIII